MATTIVVAIILINHFLGLVGYQLMKTKTNFLDNFDVVDRKFMIPFVYFMVGVIAFIHVMLYFKFDKK